MKEIMRYLSILILFTIWVLFPTSCNSKKSDTNGSEFDKSQTTSYNKFHGNYVRTFCDLPDLHLQAAAQNGIEGLKTLSDTLKYKEDLSRLPLELSLYRIDRLQYSIPFLVPKASDLLIKICHNFQDSLISKNMSVYRPIVTSLTRTSESISRLRRRNFNASEYSPHNYATTFDISWKKFEKLSSKEMALNNDKLKFILGEVLNDLRNRQACYIKYERKQACFHITAR